MNGSSGARRRDFRFWILDFSILPNKGASAVQAEERRAVFNGNRLDEVGDVAELRRVSR